MYKLTDEQCTDVIDNASKALADYCENHNLYSVVLGVSGGLDSAVTLGLACRARNKYLPELKVICVSMPHKDSDEACVDLATKAAHAFKPDAYSVISFPEAYHYMQATVNTVAHHIDDQLEQGHEKDLKIPYGNIMARIRMIILYHIANVNKGMVLSTDNLSELWMGFWTICGDVDDYGMIQNVMKGLELPDIARVLGVPQEIIDARPDDGLGVTEGGDEGQLGADYATIDRAMLEVENCGCDTHLRTVERCYPEHEHIRDRYFNTHYKRHGTFNLSRFDLGLPSLREALDAMYDEDKK